MEDYKYLFKVNDKYIFFTLYNVKDVEISTKDIDLTHN